MRYLPHLITIKHKEKHIQDKKAGTPCDGLFRFFKLAEEVGSKVDIEFSQTKHKGSQLRPYTMFDAELASCIQTNTGKSEATFVATECEENEATGSFIPLEVTTNVTFSEFDSSDNGKLCMRGQYQQESTPRASHDPEVTGEGLICASKTPYSVR